MNNYVCLCYAIAFGAVSLIGTANNNIRHLFHNENHPDCDWLKARSSLKTFLNYCTNNFWGNAYVRPIQ